MVIRKAEERAARLCESIKSDVSRGFIVEWRKSRTHGLSPYVGVGGGNAVSVSCTGYHKLSAALAQLLCHLGETEDERDAIARVAGAGAGAVTDALAKIGWKLEEVASSERAHAFVISRAT